MNTESGRPWRRWLGVAAIAVTSGTAGWALGQHGHDGRDPTTADAVDAPLTTEPRLRSELGRRGAVPPEPVAFANNDTVVVSDSLCEPADADSGLVDLEDLTRTLADGADSERFAALTRLLEAGIDLPPELLRQTYASDPSESVRLLAFTSYVDSVSDDRIEVRAALQSGAYNDSSAVQAEAQRRLAELEQFERALAETPLQGERLAAP